MSHNTCDMAMASRSPRLSTQLIMLSRFTSPAFSFEIMHVSLHCVTRDLDDMYRHLDRGNYFKP